jgi:hypothetical protein
VPPRPISGTPGHRGGAPFPVDQEQSRWSPAVERLRSEALCRTLYGKTSDSTNTSRCDEKPLGSTLADGCTARVAVAVAHYAIKYQISNRFREWPDGGGAR